jgi:hypothetical protein
MGRKGNVNESNFLLFVYSDKMESCVHNSIPKLIAFSTETNGSYIRHCKLHCFGRECFESAFGSVFQLNFSPHHVLLPLKCFLPAAGVDPRNPISFCSKSGENKRRILAPPLFKTHTQHRLGRMGDLVSYTFRSRK